MSETRIDEFPALQQDRATSEQGERKAGLSQLVLLLAGVCMPVLGVAVIAPVMPEMGRHFSGTPGRDVLVPLVLTFPALFLALSAPFAGVFADKVDRKRLLLIGMVGYSAVGTAPLYLDSLVAIAVSRMTLGICEGAILTCCLTLVGDYWSGSQRAKYLGLNTVVAALAGTALIALGGLIGVSGWRAPFWVYLVPVLLVGPMAKLLWRPSRSSQQAADGALEPLPRQLIMPCLVTLFGGVVFYALIVELPFILDGIGLKSTAAVGGISAAMQLAIAIGSGVFAPLSGLSARVLVSFELAGTAIGFGIVVAADSVWVATVGAVITGFSTGMLTPTLLVWAVNRLAFGQRGRGNGWWLFALFLGEFSSALVVPGLAAVAGGLRPAFAALAVLTVGVAGIILLAHRRAERLASPAATEPAANPA